MAAATAMATTRLKMLMVPVTRMTAATTAITTTAFPRGAHLSNNPPHPDAQTLIQRLSTIA
eukprot:7871158-Lingulodinium_polyedra.AAC.1